jgi:hypothetical protein
MSTIFGHLDVRTLCTARLVCNLFRNAASPFVHSVSVPARYLRERRNANFNHFPRLQRVRLSDVGTHDFRMLARPSLFNAVTELNLVLRPQPSRHIVPLPPLPNLVSVTVRGFWGSPGILFSPTLQELLLDAPIARQHADPLTQLTNLTSLRIYLRHEAHNPFHGLTTLTALQRLELECDAAFIACVAALTLLTHLRLWPPSDDEMSVDWSFYMDLAPLTRLHHLMHLGIGPGLRNLNTMPLTNVDNIVRLGPALLELVTSQVFVLVQLTALKSLYLQLMEAPCAFYLEATTLSPLSGLTTLALSFWILDPSFLAWFNLEGLRDLTLVCFSRLGLEGVAALSRATGLTRLDFQNSVNHGGPSGGLVDLRVPLLRMPRLQSLSLLATPALGTSFAESISVLTALTTLVWVGGHISNADVQRCLGLRKLQVLSLLPAVPASLDLVTPETLSAVAKLPELAKFRITGILGVHPQCWQGVQDTLNEKRHCKGWPPMDLQVIGPYWEE